MEIIVSMLQEKCIEPLRGFSFQKGIRISCTNVYAIRRQEQKPKCVLECE